MNFRPGIGTRRTRIFLVAALAAAIVFGVPRLRVQALSAAGWALVESDPKSPADIIVIATDADGAGVLEAADLISEGISSRVALFADPPSPVDREFIRRGVPYFDAAAVSEQQLHSLGIREVERIARPVSGTEDEGVFLPGWCDQRGFQTVLLISLADHSRRMHRVLTRAMGGHPTRVFVSPSRYSEFNAANWWLTRNGIRTEIVELQKLLLDMLRHPLASNNRRIDRNADRVA